MEQSNSSNPNQTNDMKPSKPFKIKGKFKPKTPAPNTTSTDQPIQQPNYTAYSANHQQGQPSFQGQSPYGDQPPYYGAPPAEQQGGKLKHSGLGIASFIMSILSILSIVIGIIVAFSSALSITQEDLLMLQDPTEVESMILTGESIPSYIVAIMIGGFLMIASAVLGFIGFILGLIGLFMKQRRKVFSILGTVFNGLIFIGGFIFFVFSFLNAFAAV